MSAVLNHPERVAPATRERVLSAVAELGYVRNEAARSLRLGRSRALVMVPLSIANPFFADVLLGVEEVADAAGLVVLVRSSHLDGAREDAILRWVREQRPCGLLVTPTDAALPGLRPFTAAGTPVVTVGRVLPGLGTCSVRTDDALGGRLGAEHLLARGHRRLGYVGYRRDERCEGARAALPPDASLTEVLVDYAELLSTDRAARQLAALPAHRRPTAVLCANDLVALRLLRALPEHGLTVPDDLAVVGFDDVHLAAAAAVPLTTLRQPSRELGRAAARLVLDELDRGGRHEHADLVFRPELVQRGSTAGR